jgi:HEAT repeat protein
MDFLRNLLGKKQSTSTSSATKETRDAIALLRDLKNPVKEVRRAAAWALEKLANPATVDALIEAIADPEITGIAIQALAKIGDKRAADPLLLLLGGDKCRGVAAYALGVLKDPRAVEPVISLLKNKDFLVRQQAAEALGHLEDKRASDPLAQVAFHDPDKDVRAAAAQALEKLGDVRMVEALLADAVTKLVDIFTTTAHKDFGRVDSVLPWTMFSKVKC